MNALMEEFRIYLAKEIKAQCFENIVDILNVVYTYLNTPESKETFMKWRKIRIKRIGRRNSGPSKLF